MFLLIPKQIFKIIIITSQSLQDTIDQYKKGLLKTNNLQIFNQTFPSEKISGEMLYRCRFKNSNLTNLNLNDSDLSSRFFQGCSFKSCIFNKLHFPDSLFDNCVFRDSKFLDWNISDVEFRKTTFQNCNFERKEYGSLVKTHFDSCSFVDTNFNGFEGLPLLQTSLNNSKFSKFNKSIELKGLFFLIDFFRPIDGINGMFRKDL